MSKFELHDYSATPDDHDLTKEYGAPFPIISREEGSRYTSLVSRDFTSPRSLDFRLIQTPDDTNAINAYCRTLSFEKIVKMKPRAYHQLMLQFYTTVNFIDANKFSCRLMGMSVTVTRRTLCDIFGFREGGLETVPREFDPVGFWKEVSGGGGRGDFRGSRTPSGLIEDPVLLLMHRYVSHVVFGRGDSSRVAMKDLFYLWCLRRGVLVATPCFLIATFKSVVTNKRVNMCLGDFITAIAVYFRCFDPLDTNMTVLRTRALGLSAMMMKNAVKEGKCCKDKNGEAPSVRDQSKCYNAAKKDEDPSFREDKRYKAGNEEAPSSNVQIDGEEGTNPVATDNQPAVNTWMLISRELQQVETRMKEGFNDSKTAFDGLETKFNAMCERFKTLGESNEKLSMRITRIEEGLAKISSMRVVDLANLVTDVRELGTFEEGENSKLPDSMGKNDSLGNGITPDVDGEDVVELFPGVRLTSNSIGSKGLSKTGERTSLEDNIAHTVKNSPCPQSGHYLPQPGTNNECIKPLRSAAIDINIIDVLDSDDETNPNGAAETSKRIVGSDKVNLVQRSKRKRIESVGNLFAFFTTKLKKEVFTVNEDDAI